MVAAAACTAAARLVAFRAAPGGSACQLFAAAVAAVLGAECLSIPAGAGGCVAVCLIAGGGGSGTPVRRTPICTGTAADRLLPAGTVAGALAGRLGLRGLREVVLSLAPDLGNASGGLAEGLSAPVAAGAVPAATAGKALCAGPRSPWPQ